MKCPSSSTKESPYLVAFLAVNTLVGAAGPSSSSGVDDGEARETAIRAQETMEDWLARSQNHCSELMNYWSWRLPANKDLMGALVSLATEVKGKPVYMKEVEACLEAVDTLMLHTLDASLTKTQHFEFAIEEGDAPYTTLSAIYPKNAPTKKKFRARDPDLLWVTGVGPTADVALRLWLDMWLDEDRGRAGVLDDPEFDTYIEPTSNTRPLQLVSNAATGLLRKRPGAAPVHGPRDINDVEMQPLTETSRKPRVPPMPIDRLYLIPPIFYNAFVTACGKPQAAAPLREATRRAVNGLASGPELVDNRHAVTSQPKRNPNARTGASRNRYAGFLYTPAVESIEHESAMMTLPRPTKAEPKVKYRGDDEAVEVIVVGQEQVDGNGYITSGPDQVDGRGLKVAVGVGKLVGKGAGAVLTGVGKAVTSEAAKKGAKTLGSAALTVGKAVGKGAGMAAGAAAKQLKKEVKLSTKDAGLLPEEREEIEMRMKGPDGHLKSRSLPCWVTALTYILPGGRVVRLAYSTYNCGIKNVINCCQTAFTGFDRKDRESKNRRLNAQLKNVGACDRCLVKYFFCSFFCWDNWMIVGRMLRSLVESATDCCTKKAKEGQVAKIEKVKRDPKYGPTVRLQARLVQKQVKVVPPSPKPRPYATHHMEENETGCWEGFRQHSRQTGWNSNKCGKRCSDCLVCQGDDWLVCCRCTGKLCNATVGKACGSPVLMTGMCCALCCTLPCYWCKVGIYDFAGSLRQGDIGRAITANFTGVFKQLKEDLCSCSFWPWS